MQIVSDAVKALHIEKNSDAVLRNGLFQILRGAYLHKFFIFIDLVKENADLIQRSPQAALRELLVFQKNGGDDQIKSSRLQIFQIMVPKRMLFSGAHPKV